MIGQTIGNYRIEQKIGEGGMGAVYLGRDLMLEREVAVKALRPELARQPDLVARFRSEAVTLARLNHSNIATLYNFQRQGDDFFMIMEFVRGRTLEAIVRQSGAMDTVEAARIFCQALEGISHAHALGVIHRDIKPANLMLTESGEVKVMDFGIARVLGSARQTKTGRLIGTLEYMPPEQMRGQETDARADIYSLGILLYEMLTGRVPFECNSDYELMRAQVEDEPPSPREFKGDIPLPVELAILRALAKDPEARFQSASEFRAALISAMPEAAFKPEPRKLFTEAAIKPTRIAGTDGEPFDAFGFGEQIAETRMPQAGDPGGKPSGFDSNTGTFTLKLPSFALAAQQRLEGWLGPLNWKHYAGAGATVVALVIGGVALRGGDTPTPAKKNVISESVQTQLSPVYAPPVTLPAAAPVIEPVQQASPSIDDAIREETVAPVKAKPGSAPRPKPQQQQAARNDRPQQQTARVEPRHAQPTPTPQATAEKKEKEEKEKKKKWWQTAIEVGGGVTGEIIRKKKR